MASYLSNRWLRMGLFALVVVIAAVAATLFFRKPALEIESLGARNVSPPLEIPSFSLIDTEGRPFTRESLSGNWTLATLGFTFCPDVCPTTLMEMATLFTHFDQEPEGFKVPRFVFFSVDPFRDTPAILGEYMDYFDRDFVGVTGRPEEIKKLVAGLGLHYVYVDPDSDSFLDDVVHKPDMDYYGVVHHAGLLFITPRGELVAIMSPPFETDKVRAVFSNLRAHYGE